MTLVVKQRFIKYKNNQHNDWQVIPQIFYFIYSYNRFDSLLTNFLYLLYKTP